MTYARDYQPIRRPIWEDEALHYLEARAAAQEIAQRKAWNASFKPYLRPQRGASSTARSWIANQIERNAQLIALLGG
jgi:hypothetical protein